MNPDPISTEICIIGAGPAGAAASMTLSRNGIPHVVAEATRFPRHKPCGDILTSGALRALNDLDPDFLAGLRKQGKLLPIWHTLTYPPNGKPIVIDFLPFDRKEGEPGCYSVSRLEMDLALLGKIESSGFATVLQECRITRIDREAEGMVLGSDVGHRIQARMVLVATGSSPQLLKLLGLSMPFQDCALGIRGHFEGIDVAENETSLFLDPSLMPGGLYITPLPEGRFNVNLVVSHNRVSASRLNLREAFESVVARNPVLKEKFRNARRVGNFEGSMLFLGLRKREISGDRFLVAGDSAGLIEFFSGNGIPQALQSGKMAALQAVEALKREDFSAGFLSGYQEVLYRKIKPDFTSGRLVYPLLHQRFFSRWVLGFLDHLSDRPGTNFLLRDLLYDRDPAKKLRNLRYWYDLLLGKPG